MSTDKVFRNIGPLPKHRVSALLSAGWARIVAIQGKGSFADRIETTTRTVDNGLTGNTLPEAHTIFNSLVADRGALDELFAEYGLKVVPIHAEAANDMATVAGFCDAAGELASAIADGHRNHTETLRVADKLRPHLPAAMAIVREADAIRGAA